jgi:ABC-type transporter Mla subunit MlaD
MFKKALIIFSCLLLLSGCSLLADSGTKKELMDQMDKLMDHHDKNMGDQRTLINDFNKAYDTGTQITQAMNQGSTMSSDQYNTLMADIDKANNDLATYKKNVDSLLAEIPAVEQKANELKNEEAKSRATKYLQDFKQATQSQVDYINNFQSLIDSYKTVYVSLSQGNTPDTTQYQQFSDKEGTLVDKFNKEIDAFNNSWTTLNQEDFNRKVKENISF